MSNSSTISTESDSEKKNPALENNELTKENAKLDASDQTDGKHQYEWQSKYPIEAKKIIRFEAWYLFIVCIFSLAMIFVCWKGYLSILFEITGFQAVTLRKFGYYCAAGMLGGSVFAIKYMYRVVARGYWHIDRQLWRYMTPFVSMAIAFISGALIEASLMSTGAKPSSGATIVGVGFLVGYFADQAVAKMYEIANVVFGPTVKS